MYYLATMSSFSDLQNIGSSYRYNDILAEAESRDIVVYHIRLVREDGEYRLEGEPLSQNPGVGLGNDIADLLDLNQLPFIVSCVGED